MSLAGAGKGEVEPPVLGPDHEFNVPAGARGLSSELSCSPVIRRTAVSHGLLVWCLFSPAWPPVPRGCRRIARSTRSRTPGPCLGFEPYRTPGPGRWSGSLALDYASTIEHESEPRRAVRSRQRDPAAPASRGPGRRRPGVRRTGRRRRRRLSPDFSTDFSTGTTASSASRLRERERRPRNAFLYQLELPDGQRAQPSLDQRISWRRPAVGRDAPWPAPADRRHGYPADVHGAGRLRARCRGGGFVTTVRAPLAGRLIYEGSLGVGYTPRHGDLEPLPARRRFVSGSSGLRWRFWGRQSIYGNLFVHSPYYHDTTVGALDRRELSLDFGWILATRSGAGVAARADGGPGARRAGHRPGLPAGGHALRVRCRPAPP